MSMPAPPRRFPWWIYWLLLGLIAIFALWPFAPVMLAENIVSAHGCRLEGSSVQPCMINGKDEGVTLYNLSMMAWFILLTLPVGFCLAVGWSIVLLVHRSAWKKAAAT
jgi:hypothetical protein